MSNCDEIMRKLIATLTLQGSYWGFVFSKVKRRSVEGMAYPMAVASDPDSTLVLLYSPFFIREENFKSLEPIIEHEGMHLINKHIPRLYRLVESENDKEKKQDVIYTFNYAADYAVNSLIDMPKSVKFKDFGEYRFAFPDQSDLPDKQSAEFYFFKLLKQMKKEEGGKGGEGKGKGSKSEGSGEEKGGVENHKEWINGKVSDMLSFARKIETFTQDIARESLMEAQSRGTVPAYLSEMVRKLLEPPQVPYYQIIRKLVKSSRISKFRSSSTRINRKRTYVFAINEKNIPEISPFPGRVRDYTFNIGVLIDTSGSMRMQQIIQGLSGVKNIIENDRHCKTTVIEVDASVQKEYIVKRVADIQFNIKGRGGTILYPALERFRELKVDIVLAFTDGWCENINQISRKLLPRKIVWVILNGSPANVDKTGYVINLKGKF